MRDQAVLRFEQGEAPQRKYDRFSRLPRLIQEEVLKLAVRRDVNRLMAVGLKLALEGVREDVIPKVLHLQDVLQTNAFETAIDDPESPGGLFLNASRLNHPCLPNADHFCGDKLGWKSFVANRDITEGEEITISNIDPSKQLTERQRELRNWAIDCQCPACDVNHPKSRAHEYRLKRIARLYQDHPKHKSGHLGAGISRSRSILEDASVWSRKRIKLFSEHPSFHKFLRQAYLEALDIAIIQYKLDRLPSKLTEAIEFLERVIELDLMFYGGNSATTSRDRKFYLRLKQGHVP